MILIFLRDKLQQKLTAMLNISVTWSVHFDLTLKEKITF